MLVFLTCHESFHQVLKKVVLLFLRFDQVADARDILGPAEDVAHKHAQVLVIARTLLYLELFGWSVANWSETEDGLDALAHQ